MNAHDATLDLVTRYYAAFNAGDRETRYLGARLQRRLKTYLHS